MSLYADALFVWFGNITALDYPYVTTLLPNNTIEIHSIETQTIVQVLPAPPEGSSPPGEDRKVLVTCQNGFFIPSTQRSEKLRMAPQRLLRKPATPGRENGGGTIARGEDNPVPDIPTLDA